MHAVNGLLHYTSVYTSPCANQATLPFACLENNIEFTK